ELAELERGMSTRPIQNVVTVDDQRSVEPVLHDAVRLANAVHDRVQLEIGFNEIPVVLVADAGIRLKDYGAGYLFVIEPIRSGVKALGEHVRLRHAVASAGGTVFSDTDQIVRQSAITVVHRLVVLNRETGPAAVLVVLLDINVE